MSHVPLPASGPSGGPAPDGDRPPGDVPPDDPPADHLPADVPPTDHPPADHPPTPQRRAEVDAVCAAVVGWARSLPDVEAVGLAGSWARGAATSRSDVDLVVLTRTPERYRADAGWVAAATGRPGTVVRTRQWGPLTERRVRLGSGLEVELGFASPRWAAEPVDDGTARVVRDGFRVLHDPLGVLACLVAAVGAAPRQGDRPDGPVPATSAGA